MLLLLLVIVSVSLVVEKEEDNHTDYDNGGENGRRDNNCNEFMRDGFVGRRRRTRQNEGRNIGRKSYKGR